MYMTSQIAKLNHLSFPSPDLEGTASFFEKYFGCTVEHKMPEAWVLKHGEIDIVIETPRGNPTNWPKNFHLGFELSSVAEVRDLYKTFKDDGVQMDSEIFNNTRGSRFFARTNCGILFEVNTREDMQKELWQNNNF